MPPDDDKNVIESTLDDVAASLLVKSDDKTPVVQKPVKNTPEASNDETAETEDSDDSENEEVGNEETANEDADDSQTDDEEDVDIDELEIDLSVDGEEKKVKLKDLKARYAGEGAIEKRLQEASEIRTKALDLGKHLHTNLLAESERLVRLDEILKSVAEPEINWEELKRTNLPRYLLERDKQRDAEDKRRAVASEKARVDAERQANEARAYAEYTTEQAQLLAKKMPEMADREKATQTFAKLTKTASKYGYAPEEVGGVVDHRAMLVLNDAMKYHELMEKQGVALKKTAPATTLLRPGAKASKAPSSAKKLQEALSKRARASGKVDDVAATLLVRKK